MSEKKRTTETTIETHELWIIRKAVPEPSDEAETFSLLDTVEPAAAVSSTGDITNSETSERLIKQDGDKK